MDSMPNDIENFYLQKPEPVQSCLLALRECIVRHPAGLTETRKYGMPCYCYKGKPFCYLWTDRKSGEPYILIVEGRKIDHPTLETGTRSRMKILRIDPAADIPLDTIHEVFALALAMV